MHIISGGHQLNGGAYGIINETTENRKIVDEIKRIDNSFLDVTINYETDADTELINKVSKVNELCNSNVVDCYSDIHFNAFNGSAKGVECVILGYNSGLYASEESYNKNYAKAKKVCDSISKAIGIFNRGVKTSNEFYVLTKPNCHSIIIEVCFLDNEEDMSKYNLEKVSRAIVEGLKGTVVENIPSPPIKEEPKPQQNNEYEIKSYSENGICTIVANEGVYFYDKPSISNITGSYEYGESVYYDYVVITNKYIYISWISVNTGSRRYMPVFDKINNERWGKCK